MPPPAPLPPTATAPPVPPDTAAAATRGCAELGRGAPGRAAPATAAAVPIAHCARHSPPKSDTETDAPTAGGSEEVAKRTVAGEGEWRVRTEGDGEAAAQCRVGVGEELDCGSCSNTLPLSAMT